MSYIFMAMCGLKREKKYLYITSFHQTQHTQAHSQHIKLIHYNSYDSTATVINFTTINFHIKWVCAD